MCLQAGITFQRHAEDTMAAAMAPAQMHEADTEQPGREGGVNRDDVRYGIATQMGEKVRTSSISASSLTVAVGRESHQEQREVRDCSVF